MSVRDIVSGLYLPLHDAVDELARRRTDAALLGRVQAYFQSSPLPASLRDGPRSVFAPSIITPNFETLRLVGLLAESPYPAQFYEFGSDKFVHLNYMKRCLGRLAFVDANSGSREVTSSISIVDFQTAQGKPMNEITTQQGEPFIEFHHRILHAHLGAAVPPIEDFSEWFVQSKRFSSTNPYMRYLGLFLVDAVLFANFTTEKHEAQFTSQIVLPAFDALKAEFGIAPLIVPIEPPDSDDHPYWGFYPEEVRPHCLRS